MKKMFFIGALSAILFLGAGCKKVVVDQAQTVKPPEPNLISNTTTTPPSFLEQKEVSFVINDLKYVYIPTVSTDQEQSVLSKINKKTGEEKKILTQLPSTNSFDFSAYFSTTTNHDWIKLNLDFPSGETGNYYKYVINTKNDRVVGVNNGGRPNLFLSIIYGGNGYTIKPSVADECKQNGFYKYAGIRIGDKVLNLSSPIFLSCKEYVKAVQKQELGELDVTSVSFSGFSRDFTKAYLSVHSFKFDVINIFEINLTDNSGVEIKALPNKNNLIN